MKADLQKWFNFEEVKNKKYNKSIWIPLRSSQDVVSEGSYGYAGYVKEYLGLASVAFPLKEKEKIKELGWDNISIGSNHFGYVDNGIYHSSEEYNQYDELNGINFVLDQLTTSNEKTVWHIHQDIVLTLKLIRENDVWLSPNEGYIEVIKLTRNDNGNPCLIEMRAEYLKDYLCAREMGLYISLYSDKDTIFDTPQKISFSDEENENFTYKGFAAELHEGGMPYGDSMAVFHASRNDIDDNEDLPDISDLPSDSNVDSHSWTKKFEGKKLYRYVADLYKTEWIEPAKNSPLVKEDEIPATVFFIVDEVGTKENKDVLKHCGKWLWFKPEVMMTLSHRRSGLLDWYTKDTGRVSCAPDYSVHFGINSLGLINVYAKDIAMLPDWQQQIWVGFNISPEGGVSEELLASQVHATPTNTKAPEAFLYDGLNQLNKVSYEKLGIDIYKNHEFIPELMKKIHRFRAFNEEGLFALAKDIARVTADSFDASAMQTIVAPPKKVNWGTLKSLENLISKKIDNKFARQITAPLVGIYELRLADAHLPSSKIEEAFALLDIDRDIPTIFQAHKMMHLCVTSIFTIIDILNKWDDNE